MKLAVFDFDGTLFSKDTLPFLLKQWKYNNYSRIKYYKALANLVILYTQYKLNPSSHQKKEHMKMLAVNKFNNIFSGMTKEEVDEFFSKACREIMKNLNKPVVEEIIKTSEKNYHTVFLSGAYSLLLDKIGQELNVDKIIGSNIYFKNNIFNSYKFDFISGNIKKERLLKCFEDKNVDWSASLSYADSYSDLPILELVGYPVAVNPDVKLKEHAKKKGWRIIENF